MAAEVAALRNIGRDIFPEAISTGPIHQCRLSCEAQTGIDTNTVNPDTDLINNAQLPERDNEESETSTTFLYEPLDSTNSTIRLLEVLPGSQSDTIRCQLLHCTLGDCPQYAALSYTWDHEAQYENIECHGMPLPISKNLWRFLAQFRTTVTDAPTLLWVDAICINQNDVRERNHQVRQMRDIYSCADSVIVWLGEANDEADLAFEFLEGPKQLKIGKGAPLSDLRRHRSNRQWKALERLFNRPYWTRVWIIQEFILAKSVTLWCGELSANLDAFYIICRWLDEQRFSHHESSSRVVQSQGWTLSKHRALWWQENDCTAHASGFSLRDLLRTYISSHSTDLRDKVYAFLGIATDTTNICNSLDPDYAKTPVQVLVDVIRNQCQWGTPEKDTENLRFINLLKDILGVSHSEAGRYVLEHAPDLQRHVHMIASTEFMYAPMHCVSTIIEVDFDVIQEGLSSKRKLGKWGRASRNILIDPQRLSASAVVGLLEQMNDVETKSILSCEIEPSFAREHDSDSQVMAALEYKQDVTQELSTKFGVSPNKCDTQIITRDLEEAYGRSFAITMVAHVTAKEAAPTIHQTPRIFVGTDGIIGLTTCKTRPGDYLCTFTQTENTNSAFILRRKNQYSAWVPIGSAFIVKQELDEDQSLEQQHKHQYQLSLAHPPEPNQPIYHPSRLSSDYIVPARRLPSHKDESFNFLLPSHVSAHGTQLRYFFRPTYLPELFRCQLLDLSFVPKVLDQSPRYKHIGGLAPSVGTASGCLLGSGGRGLGYAILYDEDEDLTEDTVTRKANFSIGNTTFGDFKIDRIAPRPAIAMPMDTLPQLKKLKRWDPIDDL